MLFTKEELHSTGLKMPSGCPALVDCSARQVIFQSRVPEELFYRSLSNKYGTCSGISEVQLLNARL